MPTMRFREALRAAMIEEMERDPLVMIMGEEVGHYQGAYKVTEEWEVSSSINVQSGRPRNCFGIYAGTEDPEAADYGPSSFYCDNTDDGVINPVLSPRGTFQVRASR